MNLFVIVSILMTSLRLTVKENSWWTRLMKRNVLTKFPVHKVGDTKKVGPSLSQLSENSKIGRGSPEIEKSSQKKTSGSIEENDLKEKKGELNKPASKKEKGKKKNKIQMELEL